MVNCAWWAAAVHPVVLSIGALFSTLDLDLLSNFDVQPIKWRKLVTFKYDEDDFGDDSLTEETIPEEDLEGAPQL